MLSGHFSHWNTHFVVWTSFGETCEDFLGCVQMFSESKSLRATGDDVRDLPGLKWALWGTSLVNV